MSSNERPKKRSTEVNKDLLYEPAESIDSGDESVRTSMRTFELAPIPPEFRQRVSSGDQFPPESHGSMSLHRSTKELAREKTSSTLTFLDFDAKKSKKRFGTTSSAATIQRWNLVKENLFIIMLEKQSKEKMKEKAVEEANRYASENKGWEVVVKVESESDYASTTKSTVSKGAGGGAEEVIKQGKCSTDCNCCGLRRRKRTEAEPMISRNVAVPNTHISCRTSTMQKLCNLMQNDAINYEHCVREYYQPIIEDFGYIGRRKFHLLLWMAIMLHVILTFTIIWDILFYKIVKDVKWTSRTFTSTILLSHIFCFAFSALSYIYLTQLGVVRGRMTRFCHLMVFFSVISVIVRAIIEIAALDYRKEVFKQL